MSRLDEVTRALALFVEGERLRRDHIEAARMRQERLRVASEMAVLKEAVGAVGALREMLPTQEQISPELLLPRRSEPMRVRFELVVRLEPEDKEQHNE
jgi:hypothetical protein